jgi:hypothetical protein
MRRIAVMFAVMGVLLMGCKTLQPGGVYAPTTGQTDSALYTADSTYKLAYSTVDAAFKFEKENRVSLWKISPDIKHGVDKVRIQAWAVNQDWARARQAYEANPVSSNLSALQTVIGRMEQLVAAVQAAMLPAGGAQ